MKSKSSCSIYEGVEKFDSYLEHHGITGQKWGVRHGPPYPLESTTSGRVKSQGQINMKEDIFDNLFSVDKGTGAIASWPMSLHTQEYREAIKHPIYLESR